MNGSRKANARPSRLVSSEFHGVDPGAESASVFQPRATPWHSESMGAPCKAAGILRPGRAEPLRDHIPGALPRDGGLRAVGARSWLDLKPKKTAMRRDL